MYYDNSVTATGTPISSVLKDQYNIPQLSYTASNNDLIRVNGKQGADVYPTRPNTRIVLFDMNEDIMYIKTTDAGGYATVEEYTFMKKEAAPAPIDKRYVTIEDFENFKEALLNGKFTIQQQSTAAKYRPTWESDSKS